MFDGETDYVLAEELRKIPNEFNELLKQIPDRIIHQAIGCPARCPGCGIKCELPAKTRVDEDHQHSSHYHLPMAFNGWPLNQDLYPHLSMCYQQWQNKVMYRGDQVFSTPEDFFLGEASDWYEDVKAKSTTGEGHHEIYPLPEQRRAWMAVRSKLLSEFGLQDLGRYHSGAYPTDIKSVPNDYEVTWKPL